MNRTVLIVILAVLVLAGLGYVAHSIDLIGLVRAAHGG